MTKYYDIIKAPIITEQSMKLVEQQNRYTFKVDTKANKVEIKKAVEAIFNVKVAAHSKRIAKFKRMVKMATNQLTKSSR